MMHQTPRPAAGEPLASVVSSAAEVAQEGHLLVRVGAEWFALPLCEAEEAVEAPELRELALGPASCVGAVWWRAQHLPVHAAAALGVVAHYPPNAVLVLAGDAPVAIAVDEVADVVTLAHETVRTLAGLRDPFGVVSGVTWHDGRLLTVLDVPSLAASLAHGAEPARREVA